MTSFVNDALGRPLAVVDANGNRTSSVYDGRGLLMSVQDATGAVMSFAYDAVGNQVGRVDARGVATSYTVDALNRTTGVLYPNGSRVTMTFLPDGQTASMSDLTGLTTYGYDGRGLLNRTSLPGGLVVLDALDALGNSVSTTDPDGGVASYTRDTEGHVAQVLAPWGEVTTLSYDALDRETQRVLANGMTVSHTYDAAGRETARLQADASGATVAGYTAIYDAVGNRLSTLEADGSLVSYVYDASYQLVNEQRSGATSFNTTYVYDALGNRLEKNESGTVTSYSYGAANRLLSETTGAVTTTYAYDANGNQQVVNAGGAAITYTWDEENRLTQVANPDGTTALHEYSYEGKRRRKVDTTGSDTETTIFVWHGENVLQEKNANHITQVQYSGFNMAAMGLALGELIAQRRGDLSSWTSNFYCFDLQGNTRLLTDASGAVTDRYTFDAFGRELMVSGSTPNPFRYEGAFGYQRDAADLLYVGARKLKPSIGRWISTDPIDFEGGDWNLYRYVGNNPVTMVDPSGWVVDPRPGSKCCIRVVFAAFIPTKNVKLSPWGGYWGEGDGPRGYSPTDNRYRVMHTVVINQKTGKISKWEDVRRSIVKLNGKVIKTFQPLNRESLMTDVNADKVRGGWNIHIEGNPRSGSRIFSGITYRLQIHIFPNGSARYRVGYLDAYPAYEMYEYEPRKNPGLMLGRMPQGTVSAADLTPIFGYVPPKGDRFGGIGTLQ